jgi:hypothetical protein
MTKALKYSIILVLLFACKLFMFGHKERDLQQATLNMFLNNVDSFIQRGSHALEDFGKDNNDIVCFFSDKTGNPNNFMPLLRTAYTATVKNDKFRLQEKYTVQVVGSIDSLDRLMDGKKIFIIISKPIITDSCQYVHSYFSKSRDYIYSGFFICKFSLRGQLISYYWTESIS